MLAVRSLAKSFGQTPVFRDVSFDVAAGEALALTGESGSGKSTLLHLLAGLDHPDTGTITVAGQEIQSLGDKARAAYRRDTIGLVFQQFNLIPSLSVGRNLTFQARLAGRADDAWTSELAHRLSIDTLLHRYPEELSGGQQQRVAIGRALALRPGLILADEPTGNLDRSNSDEVMAVFRDLITDTGAALVMVTHSDRLADTLDRQLHLENGALT